MIHKVNNGFVVGVVKKKEATRLFSTGEACQELYVAKDLKQVLEVVKKIGPQLVQVDDVSVEEDDE